MKNNSVLASSIFSRRHIVTEPKARDDDSFSVECYLWNFLGDRDGAFDYSQERTVLHRLAKKVDVVKSLKTHYSSDLSRSVSHDVISDQYVCVLVDIFLYSFKTFRDFKLLNTALKICDGILDDGRPIKGLDDVRNSLDLLVKGA